MTWNLGRNRPQDTLLAASAAEAPAVPVYRTHPMRAAFGPVLSVVNPAPPVSHQQRVLQALTITLIGLIMVSVPFLAFGYAAGELGGMSAPTAGQDVPGETRVGEAQMTYPTHLPLASPGPAAGRD